MARDYKYRANRNKKKQKPTRVAWWKWLLIILLICLFISFLVFLSDNTSESTQKKQQTKSVSVSKKTKTVKPKTAPKTKTKAKAKAKRQDKKPEAPQYVFYRVLSEEEVIIDDHEIKTRSREERLGKNKTSKYLIQAGSFREIAEADKLKARLTLLGFQPRIEKAKVKNTVWNRIRMGPYTHPSKVASEKKRLKDNGIDVIVTEVKK